LPWLLSTNTATSVSRSTAKLITVLSPALVALSGFVNLAGSSADATQTASKGNRQQVAILFIVVSSV
jgi:hypothetical protein